MTPAARLAAAAQILDEILAGQHAEAALTAWGRGARYAGSGDRAAVRDVVFDALRCKRSFAALGGGLTGRGLVLGGLREGGVSQAALDQMFSGEGHALPLIGPADQPRAPNMAEASDLPDWLLGQFEASLGAGAAGVMAALRARAPVFLRVNPARATRAAAADALAEFGIKTSLIHGLNYGLQVVENARKITQSASFLHGWVELQDAASQAVIEALDLPPSGRILDYCAGGGGKTLSLAAQAYENKNISIYAHDGAPRRMGDLPARAGRAGATIEICENPEKTAPYGLILTDVPCSGSGSWRRDPQGKWALTPQRLQELQQIQAQIIDTAAALLAPKGTLAYATCSVLRGENEDQIFAALQRHPQLSCQKMLRFGLGQSGDIPSGDGFFLAVLRKV
jgi:16S rRNA (cytosine967-C5)-methyltransferase